MQKFIARHRPLVSCVLSGFDRLVFRGSLRHLRSPRGIYGVLDRAGVRQVDFGQFAEHTTERVIEAALKEAKTQKRPILFLESSRLRKEDVAREFLQKHPLEGPGLICALEAVEPCMRFVYHRSADPQERGFRLKPSKCKHIYKYYRHPTFGFMHLRLQTYLPFDVQICMNGREWLATQLAARGSEFERADNCFTRLADPVLAQQLMEEQLRTAWSEMLDGLLASIHPLHSEIFRTSPMSYWWVGYQTEWATDLLFKDAGALAQLYPALVRHAVDHFKSPDVIRFLGKHERQSWSRDIHSSFSERCEGVRVKHWLNGNSVKMYDKASQILRVETTIGNPRDFSVLRPRTGEEGGGDQSKLAWLNMRKSVADLHRRAEISQRSNERYLDALAVVDETTPCSRHFDAVSRPVVDDGRRFRALRLHDRADLDLLEAVSRGEFVTSGFRNRDLRRLVYAEPKTEKDARQLSGKVSRFLRLLRAHGLIRKVQNSHRYHLTERGRLLTAALRATRDANIQRLLSLAAA